MYACADRIFPCGDESAVLTYKPSVVELTGTGRMTRSRGRVFAKAQSFICREQITDGRPRGFGC